MATGSISTIEEVNRVVQDLQDQINLLKNKPQNLHGRTSQQAQDPSTHFITRGQLEGALAPKAMPPGTTNMGGAVSGLLAKANVWKLLQTFLSGIYTKFVTIFSSGMTPASGVSSGGNTQWTESVSVDNHTPSNPQGFWLLDSSPGSFVNRAVVYINHNPALTVIQKGTFWQDFFCPYTDMGWDLGKSSAGGIYKARWGGIYAMVGRFEGTATGSGAPVAAGVQGLDIGMNFIQAGMGPSSGIYQPLVITAGPLTLTSSASFLLLNCIGITLNGANGFDGTVALAKLTSGGTNGSLTVSHGLVTAYTPPT